MLHAGAVLIPLRSWWGKAEAEKAMGKQIGIDSCIDMRPAMLYLLRTNRRH